MSSSHHNNHDEATGDACDESSSLLGKFNSGNISNPKFEKFILYREI
jgi:hypothetical protein